MQIRSLGILTALLALASAAAALAQPAPASWPTRIEIQPFRSITLTADQFLRGDKAAGKEVWLAGELRIPPSAPAKVPAVILIHGSGGISSGPESWARDLNAMGIAAYILDAFAGRGIVSTVEDQNQLHSLAMMVDAYRALDVLAANPRIKADKIAVMGFSKGAVAAVYSAMDRFRGMYGGGNRFAAHLGFYTPCNTTYDGDTKVSPVPLRLYHGIVDDYVSIGPCRDYVARLKQAGADAELAEYPDSQHGFDSPTAPPLVAVATAQSTRNCLVKESASGQLLNAATSAPFNMADPCVATGAHVGGNQEQGALARKAVRAFLKDVLLN